MDPVVTWWTSLAGIAAATGVLVQVFKRAVVRVPYVNLVPIWAYASVIAGILTWVANRVWLTLPGDDVWTLVMQAVFTAAMATGFKEWQMAGLGKPLAASNEASRE